jgi:hypothetical protein
MGNLLDKYEKKASIILTQPCMNWKKKRVFNECTDVLVVEPLESSAGS